MNIVIFLIAGGGFACRCVAPFGRLESYPPRTGALNGVRNALFFCDAK
jgi:hypothetical protein